MKLIYHKGLDWQRPVVTEEQTYYLLKKRPLEGALAYIAAPWATIIDTLEFGSKEDQGKVSSYLNSLSRPSEPEVFTVCQHEKFHTLLPFFKTVGIKTLFASHMPQGGGCNTKGHYISASPYPHYLNNIRIETSFLHPVITGAPVPHKDILYSFVGSKGKRHISPIRELIFKSPHSVDSVVVEREGWQFDGEVYHEQIQKNVISSVQKYINKEKSLFYSEVLSRSRFSLCPSGTGPTSIRFLESLASGAIPILLSDSMMLPTFKGINWKDCIIKIAEKDYNNLVPILRAIPLETEQRLRAKGLQAAKRCTGKAFIDNIRSYYNDRSPHT